MERNSGRFRIGIVRVSIAVDQMEIVKGPQSMRLGHNPRLFLLGSADFSDIVQRRIASQDPRITARINVVYFI